MILLGAWLALMGIWPLGTLELDHAVLSAPMLAADAVVHLAGAALVAVRLWTRAREVSRA